MGAAHRFIYVTEMNADAKLNRLTSQLVEQRLGILQVGGVEAFSEPVVDLWEQGARFVAAVSIAQQTREARRRA